MRGLIKSIERWGRRFLLLLIPQPRREHLPESFAPKTALVIRVDPRVGNSIMLTSFLEQLASTYPTIKVTVLGPRQADPLMRDHPKLTQFISFDKKRVFGDAGWFKTFRFLKTQSFDVVFEASNPSRASTTHAILTSLSQSPVKVGFKRHSDETRFTITAAVLTPLEEHHENAQRGQFLKALGQASAHIPLPNMRHISTGAISSITTWLHQNASTGYVVLNVGARLRAKHLSQELYREILRVVEERGDVAVVTYGPSEHRLAQRTVEDTKALLCPPTSLRELGEVFERATHVITCDTGPMHLSVSMNTPTCGIFLTTAPKRFGYRSRGHISVDAQSMSHQTIVESVRNWLAEPKSQAQESPST